MKIVGLLLAFLLWSSGAFAQSAIRIPVCGQGSPPAGASNNPNPAS